MTMPGQILVTINRRPNVLGVAPLLCHPTITDALIITAVEMMACRNAHLHGGFGHFIQDRTNQALRLDPHFADCPLMGVRRAEMPFRCVKQRQYIIHAPAGIAQIAPMVIVLRLTRYVEYAGHRRIATRHLAASAGVRPRSFRPGNRVRLDAPVQPWIADNN